MTYKEVVQWMALFFMAWEAIKLFIPHIIWKNAKKSWQKNEKKKRNFTDSGNIRTFLEKKNPVLSMIGYLYLAFVFMTFITKWWWVGLLMMLLSTVSVSAIKPAALRNRPLSIGIYVVMLMDFAFTICLLSIINPILFNFIK